MAIVIAEGVVVIVVPTVIAVIIVAARAVALVVTVISIVEVPARGAATVIKFVAHFSRRNIFIFGCAAEFFGSLFGG